MCFCVNGTEPERQIISRKSVKLDRSFKRLISSTNPASISLETQLTFQEPAVSTTTLSLSGSGTRAYPGTTFLFVGLHMFCLNCFSSTQEWRLFVVYFKALSAAAMGDSEKCIRKDVEGGGNGLIWGTIWPICLQRPKRTTKTSVRIVNIPTESRT
jgi:hypothetical protein